MISRRSYTQKEDTELVALLSQGDDRALGELLHRYQDVVFGFAHGFLYDFQEAEDVVQETFLRLYRTSGHYLPKASLRTFLLRIAKNICIDLHRKKRPVLMEFFPEVVSGKTPLDLLQTAVETDFLEKAIKMLPPNQRAVLTLLHNEHLHYREIAEVMDLSVSAVESLLVRARRTLRKKAGDNV